MDSLTPKFQLTGDPGLDRTLIGTSPTTTWKNTHIKQAGLSLALRSSSPYAWLACLVWSVCPIFQGFEDLVPENILLAESELCVKLTCLAVSSEFPLVFPFSATPFSSIAIFADITLGGFTSLTASDTSKPVSPDLDW